MKPQNRVSSAANAQPVGSNYDQLSTNTGSTSNLNSTGPHTFNYSSSGAKVIGSSSKLPTIKEKNPLMQSSGRPPRRAGGPLGIVDHNGAARKLKSILGKCEDAALTS
jgi:hypothetical protein